MPTDDIRFQKLQLPPPPVVELTVQKYVRRHTDGQQIGVNASFGSEDRDVIRVFVYESADRVALTQHGKTHPSRTP